MKNFSKTLESCTDFHRNRQSPRSMRHKLALAARVRGRCGHVLPGERGILGMRHVQDVGPAFSEALARSVACSLGGETSSSACSFGGGHSKHPCSSLYLGRRKLCIHYVTRIGSILNCTPSTPPTTERKRSSGWRSRGAVGGTQYAKNRWFPEGYAILNGTFDYQDISVPQCEWPIVQNSNYFSS